MLARVRVQTDRPIGRIDRNLYGHFIEHLGRCIYGGLWAEMLVNRKFDGPDLKEFGVVYPWQSIGRGPGVRFDHDNTTFYSGRQSQKIVVHQDGARPHGVSQGPLALRRGQRYHLRLVARQMGLPGPLRLALENAEGEPHVEQEIHCPEGDWYVLEADLACPADDLLGRLAITFRGAGTLWLGAASLMPAETRQGWRADVVEAVRGLRPSFLRWPGGNFASAYHWQDGIGPRDRRPSRVDPAWGALEPNDVGTDEFMALCRDLGTEPYLCVNVGSGTPEEAAAWVEYCNGPADSTFGALRAANGHPEPYRVRYWGVGNETYGNWQPGHVDAETYGNLCLEFARAMRAVDPEIVLVGVGAQEYEAPGWNEAVLRIVRDRIDHLSLHHYTPGYATGELPIDHVPAHEELYPVVMAGPERVEELLRDVGDLISRLGLQDRVHIALDEWNVWLFAHYECRLEEPFLLRDGLYVASVFNALHRNCRLVRLASLAQLVNVLGAVYTTPTGLFLTPVYLANKLMVEHSGTVSVETEVESPTFSAPAAVLMPPRPRARYLDAMATLSEKGDCLYLSLVNRHREQPVTAEVEVAGAAVQMQGSGHRLHGPSALSGNSITNPDVVQVRPVEPFLAGNRFSYTLPAHSATVLELRLLRQGPPPDHTFPA
ncbi:MAG: alpha-L-arabinofuranosidase C-terminal domain-containing protein [Anaerolineae bacterium]|nr:alpha-L-arabinofuranosidase C-terminal domain-containing protein [Anaerolineae bacterium]